MSLEKFDNFIDYMRERKAKKYERIFKNLFELSMRSYKRNKKGFIYKHIKRKGAIENKKLSINIFVSLIICTFFQFLFFVFSKMFLKLNELSSIDINVILTVSLVFVLVFLIFVICLLDGLKSTTILYEVEESVLQIMEKDEHKKTSERYIKE